MIILNTKLQLTENKLNPLSIFVAKKDQILKKDNLTVLF